MVLHRAKVHLTPDAPLQNFGARDPTAGETESNFTDKVLGNADTSHIIRQDANAQTGMLYSQKQTPVLHRNFYDQAVQGTQRAGETGGAGNQEVCALRKRECPANG